VRSSIAASTTGRSERESNESALDEAGGGDQAAAAVTRVAGMNSRTVGSNAVSAGSITFYDREQCHRRKGDGSQRSSATA
jgi:hypothetical protein